MHCLQEDEGDDEEKDGEPKEHRQAGHYISHCLPVQFAACAPRHVRQRGTACDIKIMHTAQAKAAGAARRQEEGAGRGSWDGGLTERRALRSADQALCTGSVCPRGAHLDSLLQEAARRICS